MQSQEVRTRFAPSPTGYLHVGGARTALFNWLFARQNNGSFILRVEDTDQERNTPQAREAIFSGLSWLGLQWDEGPNKGGEFGPYEQSQRTAIYDQWFEKLRLANRVYEDQGAWRFRFERKLMTMDDLVCGQVTIDYADESINPDMVIKRSDGSYTFHFVNVIDDIEMKITHVFRGEDHLMNTPKHLQLFEALNIQAPIYAHIPLILNMDGSKMSKRDQGASIQEYLNSGYLPEAVFNFFALLGWSPKDDQEIFSMTEIIERFSVDGVNRSGAKFDITKCQWFNQQYLANLTPEDFAQAAKPFVQASSLPTEDLYPQRAATIQSKVSTLNEVAPMIAFYTQSDYPFCPQALDKIKSNPQVIPLLSSLHETWSGLSSWSEAKASIGSTAKNNGAKPGQLMFPVRVALSGASGGPDLGEMIALLGQQECLKRLERTLQVLS